jgi:hypothetical protein
LVIFRYIIYPLEKNYPKFNAPRGFDIFGAFEITGVLEFLMVRLKLPGGSIGGCASLRRLSPMEPIETAGGFVFTHSAFEIAGGPGCALGRARWPISDGADGNCRGLRNCFGALEIARGFDAPMAGRFGLSPMEPIKNKRRREGRSPILPIRRGFPNT